MYRAVVADDEHHVVDWIADLLLSNFPDMEVDRCYSGVDVLKRSETRLFDIAVLDIRMPVTDGISTAKQLLERYPDCRIVLLTGYDEFDLIYQVNGIKNIRYSLKTETDVQIIEKIRLSLQELENEKKNRQLLNEATDKISLLYHFEQRGMLMDILYSPSPQTQLKRYEENLCLDAHQEICLVLMKLIYDDSAGFFLNGDSMMSLHRCISDRLGSLLKYALLDVGNDCVFMLVQAGEHMKPCDCCALLQSEMDAVLLAFQMNNSVRIHFYILQDHLNWGRVSDVMNNLQQYVYMPQNALVNNPVYGTTITMDLLNKKHETSHRGFHTILPQYMQLLLKISSSLVSGTSETIRECIGMLFAIRDEVMSLSAGLQAELRGRLALVFLEYINTRHLRRRIEKQITLLPLYQAMQAQNFDEVLDYFSRLSDIISALSAEDHMDDRVNTVQAIKDYIENNLSRDLSVTTLSTVFNYNQSYLSRLFKQSSGVTLSQYVKTVRMQKAKQLLRTSSMSVQEISVALGFDTVQYFTMVFRKEIGATPSAYRHQRNVEN